MADGAEGTLVVDLGGKTVKLALEGEEWAVRLPSGPLLTPEAFVADVRAATAGWGHARLSVGCPGPVDGRALTLEPHNLGPGWLGFDLGAAFGLPTKVVNDAVMQALGSYDGDKMLFLGLGTGLGAALVAEDVVVPLELAHMPYRDGLTYEDWVGQRGLDRLGRAGWLEAVDDVCRRLSAGMVADHVVLGGGNAVFVDPLPPRTRRGRNENAIRGGRRIWRSAARIL